MAKHYQPVAAATVLKNPIHFLAFGFGSGLSKVAPGTFGTLAAVPLFLALSCLPLWAYVVAVIAVCLLGIWLCDQSSKMLDVHDHPGIVWDEFAGFFITMIAAPVSWVSVLLGFVLFRIFDVLKPWPISYLDKKVHGGLGIMLDDILAGVFAAICLQLILLYINY